MLTPLNLIGLSWTLWVVSWVMAALWSSRTVKRPALKEEMPSRLVVMAGAALMVFGARGAGPVAAPLRWAMLVFVLSGLTFAWWARLHLGRLWSGWIARKENHRIVMTGPYAIVRHPIYAGICAALLATAVAQAHLLAWIGACLICLAFTMRAHLEERFLRAELGPSTYDAYARRVPMLIPFRRRAG